MSLESYFGLSLSEYEDNYYALPYSASLKEIKFFLDKKNLGSEPSHLIAIVNSMLIPELRSLHGERVISSSTRRSYGWNFDQENCIYIDCSQFFEDPYSIAVYSSSNSWFMPDRRDTFLKRYLSPVALYSRYLARKHQEAKDT